MSEHLPECPHSEPDLNPGFLVMCICDRLRACEQRMLDDDLPAAAYHGQRGYSIGYRKGLAAAQEVVSWVQDIDDALDAIKALVDMDDPWDSSGMPEPPPLPPSTGVPTNPMWPLQKERK